MTTALVELRRYRLHPGRRDELVRLFEAELVAPQEALGLQVLGQFADAGDPDAFVWLRGFATPDPEARGHALAAFYGGPVWAAHADAANATMVDSDDVLLLRPARDDTGLQPGASTGAPVVATTCLLDRPLEPGELDELVEALDDAPLLALLVTADVPNAFPRLPVREGEHAVVWLEAAAAARPVPALLAPRLAAPPHVAVLHPTPGSRLP